MKQKDLAHLLGVSTATVSMALRGKGRISSDVREKVLSFSCKYRVGVRQSRRSVAALRKSTTPVRIGYCGLGEQHGWFHTGTFRGMMALDGGVRHEVLLQVADLPYGASPEKSAAQVKERVSQANLDGLIVGPSEPLVTALRELPLPKVQIGYFNSCTVPFHFRCSCLKGGNKLRTL